MAANIYRFRVNLSGWDGGPGLNTYFARWAALPVIEDVQSFANQIASAYTTMQDNHPAGTVATLDPEVDVLDDATGTLQTKAVITPPAAVGGSGSGQNCSRATMIKARFQTDAVVNGRVLRGGVFLGPIHAFVIDATGNITPTAMGRVTTAFNGMLDVAGGRLVVWHRPSAKGASDGTSGFVQTVSAWHKPAVLRSRRD